MFTYFVLFVNLNWVNYGFKSEIIQLYNVQNTYNLKVKVKIAIVKSASGILAQILRIKIMPIIINNIYI